MGSGGQDKTGLIISSSSQIAVHAETRQASAVQAVQSAKARRQGSAVQAVHWQGSKESSPASNSTCMLAVRVDDLPKILRKTPVLSTMQPFHGSRGQNQSPARQMDSTLKPNQGLCSTIKTTPPLHQVGSNPVSILPRGISCKWQAVWVTQVMYTIVVPVPRLLAFSDNVSKLRCKPTSYWTGHTM